MATISLSTQILPRSPKGEFANEPFVDFKTPENIRAMKAALDQVASQLGRVRPQRAGRPRSRRHGGYGPAGLERLQRRDHASTQQRGLAAPGRADHRD